jgi:hypothetical protein
LRGRCELMANRSDRGRGQPAICPGRYSPITRMGPRPRIPSGPAVTYGRINRPNTRLHPTANAASSNQPLQHGRHPHRTYCGHHGIDDIDPEQTLQTC